jgi:hypothetical protein
MAQASVDSLMERAKRARVKRDQHAALMREVNRYAMPERDAWNSYAPGADRAAPVVYDSTAVVATPRFANRLQQAMFPPQAQWAQASLPPELAQAEGADQVARELEKMTSRLFARLAESNFDLAANEMCHEIAAGTGCLLAENGRTMTNRTRAPLLRFQCHPSAYVAIEEGPFGVVEGVFFDQKPAARLVSRLYPDAKPLPKAIDDALKDDPEREIALTQCTYYDPDDDLFRFEVIFEAERQRIVSREYRTMPWIIVRWTKSPGEVYGRGPIAQALPDIRTLNKLVELFLISASIEVVGIWTAADDGVLNPSTVRLVPGAIIPVQSNGGPGGESLKRLSTGTNFALSETLRDQLRTAIRQVMFDDPLPPEVVAGVTATEIIERIRKFQQDTGAFGRLQADAVAPIFTRCLDILDEAGEFANDGFGDLMQLLREDAIRIKATSPLARAQDMGEAQAVMSFLSGATSLGEMGQAFVRSGIAIDRAGRFVADRMGVPQSLIPTEAELKAQDQAAQEAAQAQQLLASPAVAQVAGQVAKAAMQPPPQEGPAP